MRNNVKKIIFPLMTALLMSQLSLFASALDFRRGANGVSSTYAASDYYKKLTAVTLTGDNKKQFLIPRGFAHGFIVLEDDTVFAYKCDNVYCKAAEKGMRFDDPALCIEWPDVGVPLVLSEKDRTLPFFKEIEPEEVGTGA